MAVEQYKNNASTTLDEDLDDSETVVTVVSGAVFPATGDFRVVCESEIMICTSRSTNDLTVTRGAEGTTPAAHANTTPISHVLTAGGLIAGFLRVPSTIQDYTVTNGSVDRTYDANSTSIDELADVLGTLISDLIDAGVIQ